MLPLETMAIAWTPAPRIVEARVTLSSGRSDGALRLHVLAPGGTIRRWPGGAD